MTPAQELREQIRTDVREHRRGPEVAPYPVAPGRVLLPTKHVPTEVVASEVESVLRLSANRLGLRSRVVLLDGSAYYDCTAPADEIGRAVREALK